MLNVDKWRSETDMTALGCETQTVKMMVNIHQKGHHLIKFDEIGKAMRLTGSLLDSVRGLRRLGLEICIVFIIGTIKNREILLYLNLDFNRKLN